MFKNINIGSKITGLLVCLVLLTIVAVSLVNYNLSKKALEARSIEILNTLADMKVKEVTHFFQQIGSDVQVVQNQNLIKENVGLLNSFEGISRDSITNIVTGNLAEKFAGFAKTLDYKNFYITNKEGNILYTTDATKSTGDAFYDNVGGTIARSKEELYFSRVFPENKSHYLLAGAPLKDNAGILGGLMFIKINMGTLYSRVSDTTGMGKTGEIQLVKQFEDQKFYNLSPLRLKENAVLTLALESGYKDHPITLAGQGENGIKYSTDYRGQSTLTAWRHIPLANWGLISKMDKSEIYGLKGGLLLNFMISGFAILLLAAVIGIIFSRVLINPILMLKATLAKLSKGILPDKVTKSSNDEIGQMAQITNDLVQSLKRTANFAHKIGDGDFDADFEPLSDQDNLGNALINMRDSIQNAEKRDAERNWIVTGVAEIGEILREHNELGPLGDEVISYITDKIDAIQGAFYVTNNENEEDLFIEMTASYAYNKKKNLKASFKFAEGLVGQSAIEQATILRTEIPYDYVSVTSGILGDQRPEAILIVPLITNEQVYGVLEFAGFKKFSSTHVKFVEEISVIIARTIFNIKVNERTRKLLEDSQQMSKELQIQQGELRQNAEEMAATQDELRNTNQRLEDQIEEVNRTQKRMQLLLENASEVITIYEEDENIRYISPSVENIMGYSQAEMIGRKDLKNIHPEGVEHFHAMFKQLLDNPFNPVTIQYKYKTKEGQYIWLEATGTNKLSDPAIQGIIVNSRDITEKRRAEEEQRMRSKMQALSENSPDLITRLEENGSISYINPMIETYAGGKAEQYLNKQMEKLNLNNSITQQWANILQDVTNKNSKVSMEMDFPSVMGERIMQVNAIPEYDEHEKIESVLVVSHDITERKLIELEIQSKNKKINDSINYAKRIQGAILPNTAIINQVFNESFILYKPRDVVSGDFPWFMQVGDDIYIAAVDCTGHGVPGALISLIGYFLLNDIIRSRKIGDPGKILDLLDDGVTKTLRQDQDDSRSKDGMDIALCKVNLKKSEVEFAGAHRPLYFMEKGKMVEVKGNKFAIGGGRYRNQTNFTTVKIRVSKGDSIYICSDGYPDQFGGPENRKYGPKRTREFIEKHHQKSMQQVHKTMDAEWEKWKGDTKQTDDVLMIGIKF